MGNLMVLLIHSRLMPRHIPPSRKRYERKNPKVSVRLTESVREVLDEAKESSGLSYADLIKKGLTAAADEETAYQKGWDSAEETYAVIISCSVCGRLMTVTTESKMCEDAVQCLEKHGWHHGKCP